MTGSQEVIGKPVNSDEKNKKTTYVTLEGLDKAKKDGKEFGSKLEDTLNNQLPQLFDDAMNLFRDQMRQYNKEKPEAPTNL